MSIREIFKKQGGFKLLKQYWKCGVFFTALEQFLLLGTSKTALELLRLSVSLKVKQKLEKKYRKKLIKFDKEWKDNLPHKCSNVVWVCWFQGMENAPLLVRKCYESLIKNLNDKEIVLVTSENMSKYVTFPDYIYEKWKQGQITNAHMSDLLRLELLIKYGGMWVDATVLCTESDKEIPEYFFNSDLFLYQSLKPGRNGHSLYISSWLISAKTNNKILMATRYLCYEYWKQNTDLVEYFLFHVFLSVVLEYYLEDWKKIIPRENATPHILLLRLFDRYDKQVWKAIKEQTPFHKLTYKFDEAQLKSEGTFYQKIIS